MLINLVPEFFSVLDSSDPIAAYTRYFTAHQSLLRAYWSNYVLDPDGPHFLEVVQAVTLAERSDLRAMLGRTDVLALAQGAEERSASLLEIDVDLDIILMIGVGAANAGELVTEGKGIAFICLEHFTNVANPETQGLGLSPQLIPLWLAHEIAHTVRYTSPSSRSVMRQLIAEESGGYYSYWDTGRRAPLRELLVNEGLGVEAARAVSPGHSDWEYLGYEQQQYAQIRELEGVLTRAVAPDLDHTGLGLRLRYLSGGVSNDARTVGRHVLPERGGYYIGSQLVQRAIDERGLAWAVRAPAEELTAMAGMLSATG